MQIFSNAPLDLSQIGVVWFKSIPCQNQTISVSNKQLRTALNLGSADLPTAALEFSGSILSYSSGAGDGLVIAEDDPLDTRNIGLFLCKNESISILSGDVLFLSGLLDLAVLRTGNFGQIAVVEDGAILALNCSTETPEEQPEFWKFDSALGGWFQINIWDSGVDLELL